MFGATHKTNANTLLIVGSLSVHWVRLQMPLVHTLVPTTSHRFGLITHKSKHSSWEPVGSDVGKKPTKKLPLTPFDQVHVTLGFLLCYWILIRKSPAIITKKQRPTQPPAKLIIPGAIFYWPGQTVKA